MGTAQARKHTSSFHRHFNRTVGCARLYGFLERAWQRAAMPAAVGGVFLATSWAGAWQHVQPSLRLTGVALFSIAMAAALRPLLGLRYPTRKEALSRINKATGLPGRPAHDYDNGVSRTDSGEGAALWELQRLRLEDKVGRFRAGLPKPGVLPGRAYQAGAVIALAAGLAFWHAHEHEQVSERLTAALDWAEPLTPGFAKVDAWVTPPDYTGQGPVFIASAERRDRAGAEFTVPEGSVVTVRLHDPNLTVQASGGTIPVDEACREIGAVRQCEFDLAGPASLNVHSAKYGDLSWRFNVTPDLPPAIAITPLPPVEEPEDSALTGQRDVPRMPGVSYAITDETGGAEVSEGRLGLPQRPDSEEARPLPLFNAPAISVPVR